MMMMSAPSTAAREVRRRLLDRGKASGIALDRDPAHRADVGETSIVEIVQPQLKAGDAQMCGEIDPADPRTDDCDAWLRC